MSDFAKDLSLRVQHHVSTWVVSFFALAGMMVLRFLTSLEVSLSLLTTGTFLPQLKIVTKKDG
jgi:hypothetical protein